jgi:hypothetical protein
VSEFGSDIRQIHAAHLFSQGATYFIERKDCFSGIYLEIIDSQKRGCYNEK